MSHLRLITRSKHTSEQLVHRDISRLCVDLHSMLPTTSRAQDLLGLSPKRFGGTPIIWLSGAETDIHSFFDSPWEATAVPQKQLGLAQARNPLVSHGFGRRKVGRQNAGTRSSSILRPRQRSHAEQRLLLPRRDRELDGTVCNTSSIED